MCMAKAMKEGSYGYATEGDNKKRWMDASGNRVNMIRWPCNKCKVNLCEDCFDDFDHDRACVPPATNGIHRR